MGLRSTSRFENQFDLSALGRILAPALMENNDRTEMSFMARLGTAFACFFRAVASPDFSRQATILLQPTAAKTAPAPAPAIPPERLHASGLNVLSMLQRDGRLIDFLQENMSGFSDEEIGAAARVVHTGCQKVLKQHLSIEPILKDAEGARVQVPAGFDAQRIQLTGNVTGQPPFRGALKHHGWVATSVRMPAVSESLDPRVLAPAEVEL
jgi:hypothetical protein